MLMPRRGCVEKPISYGLDILSMMRRAHRRSLVGRKCGKQSNEFIAADAAYKILVANAFAQTAGYGDENGVARCMPESIVHFLEAVEIEAEHRELRLSVGRQTSAHSATR